MNEKHTRRDNLVKSYSIHEEDSSVFLQFSHLTTRNALFFDDKQSRSNNMTTASNSVGPAKLVVPADIDRVPRLVKLSCESQISR